LPACDFRINVEAINLFGITDFADSRPTNLGPRRNIIREMLKDSESIAASGEALPSIGTRYATALMRVPTSGPTLPCCSPRLARR